MTNGEDKGAPKLNPKLPTVEELLGRPKLDPKLQGLQDALSNFGGPAYPLGFVDIEGKTGLLLTGMSLRVYIATTILPTLLIRARGQVSARALVRDAYSFADTVIAESTQPSAVGSGNISKY